MVWKWIIVLHLGVLGSLAHTQHFTSHNQKLTKFWPGLYENELIRDASSAVVQQQTTRRESGEDTSKMTSPPANTHSRTHTYSRSMLKSRRWFVSPSNPDVGVECDFGDTQNCLSGPWSSLWALNIHLDATSCAGYTATSYTALWEM